MRRAAKVAGVLALAAIVAGSLRWPIAPADVAERLNAGLGEARPFTWGAPRAAAFSVLPWPSLRIVDARLDAGSGVNVVTAPDARIDLSLVSFALGRIVPTRVRLAAPTISLDLDQPPFAGRFGATAALNAFNGVLPFGRVSLSNGVMRVTSRTRGLDTVVEGLQGRIDGLTPGARASVDLSAVWRSAPLVISGSLDDPQRAARGKPSALRVAIASSLGDLTFNGALTTGVAIGAAGELSASSGALAEAIQLFGMKAPAGLGAADLAVSGQVKARHGEVMFDDATVTTRGQTLQGVLRLAWFAGRLSISGSLDADQLALAPLAGPLPPVLAPDGAWSQKPLANAPPSDFDVDLRISANALDAYGIRLENVAASALLKDGVLTADLVDTALYGGRLDGELRLTRVPAGLGISARAKLIGADFGAAAADFGRSDVTGKGDAEITLEATGRSPAEAIADLNGKASLALTGGVVSGVNLEGGLRRSQRRPLDLEKDLRSGKTVFEQASLKAYIGAGVAHIVDGSLVAHGVTADLQGTIDLADQRLSLRLEAAQSTPSQAAAPNAARFALAVEGPWANPSARPIDQRDVVTPGAASVPP